jgi:hypothetical protein
LQIDHRENFSSQVGNPLDKFWRMRYLGDLLHLDDTVNVGNIQAVSLFAKFKNN